MVQVIYFITKENELIFARNFKHKDRAEAIEALKATHEDMLTQDNIKDIQYTEDKLVFTDTAEGESDEIHTVIISEGGVNNGRNQKHS